MANIGYSTLTVIPTAKGFGAALSGQVDPQIAKAGTSGGKKFGGGMVSSAKSFVKPLAGLFAVSAGVAFFKGAIDGASNLNEQASKVKVVFGDQAAAIMEASKTSAGAMGLSKEAYLSATGTLGNLLVSLDIAPKKAAGLSQQMVQLAGDMASFNNTSPEEALQAITAGLTGETEPLKRFGVNMNDATLKTQALKMGLISSTKDAMSPQTKALAAQALIMDQTATAQGDFARTSDGLANKQRILAAKTADLKDKIGTALLPAVTKITSAGIKMMDWLTKNPAAMYALGAAVAVLGIAFIIATAPISLTALAIAALAGGLVYAYTKFSWFRKVVDTVFNAICAAAKFMWNNVYQPIFKFLVAAIGNTMIMFGKMLVGMSKVPGFGWAKAAGEKMQTAGEKAVGLADKIKKIPDADVKVKIGDEAAIGKLNRLATKIRNLPNGFVRIDVAGKGSKVAGFAHGTNYAPGGMAWVGEEGPELVNLPKGAQVFTHAKSKQMAEGRGGSTGGYGGSADGATRADIQRLIEAVEAGHRLSVGGRDFALAVSDANNKSARLR